MRFVPLFLAAAYLAVVASWPSGSASWMQLILVWATSAAVLYFVIWFARRLCTDFALDRKWAPHLISMTILFFLTLALQYFLSPESLIVDGETIVSGGDVTTAGVLLAIKESVLISLAVLVYWSTLIMLRKQASARQSDDGNASTIAGP
jgi:hypothetical protein